jgi:predicted TIM-barrel fold metal-dependent hydrolase
MIAVARKHENVWIDTSAYTSAHIPLELITYMKTSSAHKVLFGTNHPMISADHALAGLDVLDLEGAARERYLAGNARRVFALPIPQPGD